MSEYKPKIIGFLCNWCSYAGADLAGTSRQKHDITMRAIRVMCSGRVEPAFVLKAFMEGADGVLIAGCHMPSDCHYTNGNFKAQARFDMFQPLLEELGIEKQRLRLEWISASEGEKFARVMNEFSAEIKSLGPLKLNKRCDKSLDECALIRCAQEFAACEAASGGLVDLKKRSEQNFEKIVTNPSIVYDPNRCLRCGSCVEACKLQGIEAITLEGDGLKLDEAKCVRCGQCVMSCPLGFQDKTVDMVRKLAGCDSCPFSRPIGAMTEKSDTRRVLAALSDPDVFATVQFAPSVRSAIGEEFGLLPGEITTGKLYGAFRAAGFDRVWDTNFSADLTVMEEGTELIGRFEDGVLPQFTSCCPAWVKFVEDNYPSLIPNLSSAKSPQQMFGAVAKTYAKDKEGLDARKMFVVSVMPCTAKKFECDRPEMKDAAQHNGGDYPDVDAVLTIRECVALFKHLDIDIALLNDESPDPLLSGYSGAATIFGRTGGVMTAALRTAYEIIQGKPLEDIELSSLGKPEGIKTAVVQTKLGDVRVAVAFGLDNARRICEEILSGGEFSKYHFIEVMSCPGGCVGGGGQVMTTNAKKTALRAAGLNRDDKSSTLRTSHQNTEVKALYNDFLGSPCSHMAHELLHTRYGRGEK